jgi:hypothetical protein
MATNAITPVFRQIAAESAVAQTSLTRADRQMQMEEGEPPVEVASAEFAASRWSKNEDMREKWRKRLAHKYLPQDDALQPQPAIAEQELDPGSAEDFQAVADSEDADDGAGSLFNGRL